MSCVPRASRVAHAALVLTRALTQPLTWHSPSVGSTVELAWQTSGVRRCSHAPWKLHLFGHRSLSQSPPYQRGSHRQRSPSMHTPWSEQVRCLSST